VSSCGVLVELVCRLRRRCAIGCWVASRLIARYTSFEHPSASGYESIVDTREEHSGREEGGADVEVEVVVMVRLVDCCTRMSVILCAYGHDKNVDGLSNGKARKMREEKGSDATAGESGGGRGGSVV